MRLVPTQSPGRGTRKARDFETEIAQLRAQGYTLEAIRIALANAGVHVTLSTVWREANRAAVTHRAKPVVEAIATGLSPLAKVAVPTVTTASTFPAAAHDPPGKRNGKEVAEVFMRSQITNPLIRPKAQR